MLYSFNLINHSCICDVIYQELRVLCIPVFCDITFKDVHSIICIKMSRDIPYKNIGFFNYTLRYFGVVSQSSCSFTSFIAKLINFDHEIFSMVILLLPLIQQGLLSVTSESEYWLTA